VTLEDYKREADHKKETAQERSFYKHLYDGGPSGNLGLNTLKDMLHNTMQGARKLKGCMLVLVDAFPIADTKVDKGYDKRDLRSLFGYLVDDNLMDAFDDLLRSQRQEALRALGYPHDTPVGDLATWDYRPILSKPNGNPDLVCHVWHITMQGTSKSVDPQFALQEKLMQSQKATGTTTAPPVKDAEVYRKALNIATDFRLINPAVGDPQDLQNVLFEAVQGRVKEKEQEITDRLSRWKQLPAR
jgi:hypothetical protein